MTLPDRGYNRVLIQPTVAIGASQSTTRVELLSGGKHHAVSLKARA
jgi:hypothetical protein